jgi:hypothetical protein
VGEVTVGLGRVWVQTLGDGVVRADQITGIDAHQTPALTGKPARWLLDVVLGVPIGSGHREEWTVTAMHRTLIQTGHDPSPAAAALARLLAQLDVINAAGIITPTSDRATTDQGALSEAGAPGPGPRTAAATAAPSPQDGAVDGAVDGAAVAGGVRLRFTPFPEPEPGRHTGAEYL